MSKTKDQLIAEAAQLTVRLAQLRNDIQELDSKPEPELIWQPEKGDRYYSVSYSGQINAANTFIKYCEGSNYNYYATEEAAKADAKYLAVIRKLRHMARTLNGDWKPCYAGVNNWIITYLGQTWGVDNWGSSVISRGLGAVFKSAEAAQTALDNLTESDREILLTGGGDWVRSEGG